MTQSDERERAWKEENTWSTPDIEYNITLEK